MEDVFFQQSQPKLKNNQIKLSRAAVDGLCGAIHLHHLIEI